MAREPTTRRAPPAQKARDGGTPYLDIVDGPIPARRVEIPRTGLLIGRGPDVDLPLSADDISRQHARVTHSGDGLVHVLDLDSTNGLLVNDRRVSVAVLRPGDGLQIGPVKLRFRLVRAGEDSNRLIDLLSPRAMQVAQLVARGLTNIEIGEQLGISPRTVATHLNACFDRLEVRTRSALARRVAEDAAREP